MDSFSKIGRQSKSIVGSMPQNSKTANLLFSNNFLKGISAALSYSEILRGNENVNRATAKSSNTPRYSRRRGKSPAQFNGMHRRRSKKIKW